MEAVEYNPHHTIDDYQQWEGDWELWSGVPVAMSPSANKSHQRVARNLLLQIQQQLSADGNCPCEALFELDWHIDKDTVLRPDIAVECQPDDLPVITRPPALIVEVLSPATADKDRTAKRRKYAEQGVPYYLMADPQQRSLEVLRLGDGAYQPVAADQEISLHGRCRIRLDTAALWS